MRVGDVEIFLLTDGIARVDGGGMFGLVPRMMWEAKHPPDSQNRILIRVNCLLIKDGEHNIVVDTGFGGKIRARTQRLMGILNTGRLPGLLQGHGVEPEQVDLVINTHLHADHAGGDTRVKGERVVPAFPKASYIVQEAEWDDANNPNERTRATYLPENFLPLREAGQLELIQGDTQITPRVRCVVKPGHVQGHQCVLIDSDGERALYLADVASLAVHLEKLAWVPSYDLDPMRSIETKREIQQWAIAQDMLLIFDHDPEIGMGRLQAGAGRRWVEPVLRLEIPDEEETEEG